MDHARMSQRQTAFRADFRARIAPAYYGWADVALIYALGVAAIWYCARQVSNLVRVPGHPSRALYLQLV